MKKKLILALIILILSGCNSYIVIVAADVNVPKSVSIKDIGPIDIDTDLEVDTE